MKAKTYYIHPGSASMWERSFGNGRDDKPWAKVKVIKSSDVEKLVEKAVTAAQSYQLNLHEGRPIELSDESAEGITRVVFKSIGLLP